MIGGALRKDVKLDIDPNSKEMERDRSAASKKHRRDVEGLVDAWFLSTCTVSGILTKP